MKLIIGLIVFGIGLFEQSLVIAKSEATLDAEITRIDSAEKVISQQVAALDPVGNEFAKLWKQVTRYSDASKLVDRYGNSLWMQAKQQVKNTMGYDDRGLYWQRLKMSRTINQELPAFALTQNQKQLLAKRLETSSRGISDLEFSQNTHKRLLLTGFDPFLLDRNINQSNPSGVVALLLDGLVIEYKGITAEINTFLVPVRYADFDEGLIEETLAPFYALNNIDMVTTVSMGRKDFDLERFPGKRRSASVPGNRNIYSGGSKKSPIVSKLFNRPLPGPEFVEFSLPIAAMLKAKGAYKINDNHKITTLEKTFEPISLSELKNAIAVEGSGGGYLSNEISYRSIRLRNQLNSNIPTGHIHTPRILQFDAKANAAISEQIIRMLELALTEI